MKKIIIITAICYLFLISMLFLSIGFSYLKINPVYWSSGSRDLFAFLVITLLIIAGAVIFISKMIKDE